MGPVKSVGGLETGAISVAAAISRESFASEDIHWFFVRKKAKQHGRGNVIEGDPIEPIVLVDDVVTVGGSVLDAIEVLKSKWKHMTGVISIIDRGGARKPPRQT